MTEVVTVVVGVVASQAWDPPPTYALAISFSTVATPVHSAVSTKEAPNPHSIAGAAPAGPRNSRIAAVSAVSVRRSVPGMVVESEEIRPRDASDPSRRRLCRWQLGTTRGSN